MLGVVILAGGRATRMGGGDKPLTLLKGVPLLSHVIARVAGKGRAIALNANGDPARFAMFGLPVIADDASDLQGPLAGILAGLDWAAAQGLSGDVLSVPGDCPFLPHDLAEKLDQARSKTGLPLACAGSNGWKHPVIGLWPITIREELRIALGKGERKVERFITQQGCAIAEWSIEPYDPFFNINTPEDREEAERLVGSCRKPGCSAPDIPMSEITLDLLGLKCPLPALKTGKALQELEAGTVLVVYANDPLAGLDIPNLVRETGDRLEATRQQGNQMIFRIVKT